MSGGRAGTPWHRGWLGASLAVFAALCFCQSARAAEASWSFEPSSWDFGVRLPETGPSPPKTFTLTNTGEVELSIILVSIGSSSGAGFAIAGNSCGALSPAESCTIDVTFAPSAAGPQQGQLSVAAQGGAAPPASAQLSGTGAGPAVSIGPAAQIFEPTELGAGPSAPKTFTVANDGQLDLTISSIFIDANQTYNFPGAKPDQFQLAGGSCMAGSTVPPGGHCTVDVTFSPTVPGALTAELRIVDNAPGSPHVGKVEGFGIAHDAQPPGVPPRIVPRVAIFRRPPRLSMKREAVFWFRGSPTATRFECKLDRRPSAPCQSPFRFEHLKMGRHHFAVRAVDGNGQSGPATHFHWRIGTRSSARS